MKLLLISCFLFCCSNLFSSVKSDLSIKFKKEHIVQNLTYTEARTFLFGFLDLKDNGTLIDVYCNEEYDKGDGVGKMRIPDPNKVNCEHTWPQSKFSKNFNGETQKTDLHHLFATNSKANSLRGNYPFSELGDSNSISWCPDSKYKSNLFSPPDEHKGNVARALFYFSLRYDMPIDSNQEKILREWHKLDEVDEDERIRNAKIKKIQGNSNYFIEQPDSVDKIEDF